MGQHLRGKLGPAGRIELARLQVDLGWSERAAAAALSVSSRTARGWKQRRLTATAAELATGAWALDRSSRPHRSPARTSAEIERRICAERERTGWGPRLIAGTTGIAHSTVHAILRRHGLSRMPRTPREAVVRFEWPCPGDLLQMDTKRFGRFMRPGHRVTGVRDHTGADKRNGPGWEFCHSVIDDHSRLAYTEAALSAPAAGSCARMGTRHGVAVHVHPPWGRPIAQTTGTGRRSSTSTLSTENPPSRSRSASSFPSSRARSGAEWRASQKR
jgi:transposase